MTDRLAELEARVRRVHESEQVSNVVRHPSSPAEPKKFGDWRDHAFTAAALRSKEFPPVSFVVPERFQKG